MKTVIHYATDEWLLPSFEGEKILYLMYQAEFRRHVWLMNPAHEQCFVHTVEGAGNIANKVTVNGSYANSTPLPLFE